jgi:hypothetical protein
VLICEDPNGLNRAISTCWMSFQNVVSRSARRVVQEVQNSIKEFERTAKEVIEELEVENYEHSRNIDDLWRSGEKVFIQALNDYSEVLEHWDDENLSINEQIELSDKKEEGFLPMTECCTRVTHTENIWRFDEKCYHCKARKSVMSKHHKVDEKQYTAIGTISTMAGVVCTMIEESAEPMWEMEKANHLATLKILTKSFQRSHITEVVYEELCTVAGSLYDTICEINHNRACLETTKIMARVMDVSDIMTDNRSFADRRFVEGISDKKVTLKNYVEYSYRSNWWYDAGKTYSNVMLPADGHVEADHYEYRSVEYKVSLGQLQTINKASIMYTNRGPGDVASSIVRAETSNSSLDCGFVRSLLDGDDMMRNVVDLAASYSGMQPVTDALGQAGTLKY